jgi:hypothetical protein
MNRLLYRSSDETLAPSFTTIEMGQEARAHRTVDSMLGLQRLILRNAMVSNSPIVVVFEADRLCRGYTDLGFVLALGIGHLPRR